MKFLTMSKTASRWIKAAGATALALTLAGCTMANIQPSSGQDEPNGTVQVKITGKAHGGHYGLGYATVNLYAVDNTAYGGGPHLLTSTTSGTAEYYPGVSAAGCDNTALSPTAYAIAGGVATITAANTMIVGQLVVISDGSGSGLSGTYTVTAQTSASFTVATSISGTSAGTTSGSFIPVCYTSPTTDQNGAFGISGDFNCGAYGSSVVYVQVEGGNPGISNTTNNKSAVLTALLQSPTAITTALTCNQLSSADTVFLSELSTAAMGVSMGQFFTTSYGGSPSTDGFGSGSSAEAKAGLTNAANTAIKLVSTGYLVSTNIANGPYPIASGNYSITVTPEATKLQTIADILSSCVQGTTGNANCTALFDALRLTGSSEPTDTLQAAALFGINPTAGSPANMTTLWGLVGGIAAPFTAVSSQPSDWTIGIQYTDTNYASCTAGDSGTCALFDPYQVLTDQNGNLFVLSRESGTTPHASLTELAPSGSPTFSVDKLSTVDFDGDGPRNMAIDLNGYVWLTFSGSAQILLYNDGSGHGISPTLQPYALAIDGSNDVFVGFASTSSTTSLQMFNNDIPASSDQIEYPILCTTTTNAYTKCSSATPTGQTNQSLSEFAAVDTNGNLWLTNGDILSTLESSVLLYPAGASGYNSYTCTTYPCTNANGTVNNPFNILTSAGSGLPTFGEPYGIAAGANGVVWMANTATSSKSGYDTLAEMTSTAAGTNYGDTTTLNRPLMIAVDGAGNVWTTNNAGNYVNASTVAGSSISEFQGTGTNIGTAISPAKTGTAPYTYPGFYHSQLTSPVGISVDFSGNVWVANNIANSSTATGGIFELVGAGAPTDNPISQSLKDGKVGAKP